MTKVIFTKRQQNVKKKEKKSKNEKQINQGKREKRKDTAIIWAGTVIILTDLIN